MKETKEIKVYTIKDVAEIMQLSETTIYRHVNSGRLKGVKFGTDWRISEESLLNYIQGK